MGVVPQGKTPTISHLWPHHRAMARSLICGAQPKDLAQMYGYTPSQITRIINSPLFQAEMHRMEAQADHAAGNINQDLMAVAERAVEFLSAEMDRDAEGLQERSHKRQVAFGVLDRAGFAKKEAPQVHLHRHEHEHRAKEMADEDLYREVIDLTEDEVEVG